MRIIRCRIIIRTGLLGVIPKDFKKWYSQLHCVALSQSWIKGGGAMGAIAPGSPEIERLPDQ